MRMLIHIAMYLPVLSKAAACSGLGATLSLRNFGHFRELQSEQFQKRQHISLQE